MKLKIFFVLLAASVLLILTESCSTSIQADNYIPISKEKFRPEIHFSPESYWMNNPSGLVYFEGEYHLFYQYSPDSMVSGPMHWGHAVSNNLVDWKHLPFALYPDTLGYIFSGSAVVDLNNTTGFGKEGKPAIVAIYSYHSLNGEKSFRNDFQSQGIAYSTDKGRSWTKYDKNPVFKNPELRNFRDPKVLWNTETKNWIISLAGGDHICFYSSPNLKDWKFESEFGKNSGAHGGVWECPDLFELPVANSESEKKWVLLVSIKPGGPNGGSATQYFTGQFDGHIFTNESNVTKWLDLGKDNYAGVTFSNIPASDGRKILMGCMSNCQYTEVVPSGKWRNAMTFPRELKLISVKNDHFLTSEPVEEIQKLRERKVEWKPATVIDKFDLDTFFSPPLYPLEYKLSFTFPHINAANDFGIELYNAIGENLLIGYKKEEDLFYINRGKSGIINFSQDFAGIHSAPYAINNGTIDMHIIIDATSIELFAMQGQVVMTDIFFPTLEYSGIRLYCKKGNIELDSGTAYKLSGFSQNDID